MISSDYTCSGTSECSTSAEAQGFQEKEMKRVARRSSKSRLRLRSYNHIYARDIEIYQVKNIEIYRYREEL